MKFGVSVSVPIEISQYKIAKLSAWYEEETSIIDNDLSDSKEEETKKLCDEVRKKVWQQIETLKQELKIKV